MKTQCDCCGEREAAVFCHTEEKALCSACDHRDSHRELHHDRLAIFYLVPKNMVICDVCQETKAFIFCREHRAVLCRICDVSAHGKDELKRKHSRLILNGAKFCTGDNNDGEKESLPSTSTQVTENESGASNAEMAPEEKQKKPLDMLSSDDPYGLCEEDGEWGVSEQPFSPDVGKCVLKFPCGPTGHVGGRERQQDRYFSRIRTWDAI